MRHPSNYYSAGLLKNSLMRLPGFFRLHKGKKQGILCT
ncbi:hypothetical protein TREVI0001_1553 [Treponema vincentii ATCC 35580]|uniref:Uncharacterized protein n=1 Tax=Treponema vincentii ATCC 35580 TaxID=596324 RepID=C8PN49_9SPIR|nr:hypothetical protein TREVI0001_1553 [Treponema vincentii ATCC 35580]